MLNAIRTPNGHPLLHVVSALQKAIRRSQVDDALYWGCQMHLAGYHEYCWKRLKIICSEDIGPAGGIALPATINALYDTYIYLRSKNDGRHEPWQVIFTHAIILLAQAPKSRICDHAVMAHFHDAANQKREMPDYCIDKHSPEGRRLGRGWEHFFDESSRLIGPDGQEPAPDQFKQRARDVMLSLEKTHGVDAIQPNGKAWIEPQGASVAAPSKREPAKPGRASPKGPRDPEDPQGLFDF